MATLLLLVTVLSGCGPRVRPVAAAPLSADSSADVSANTAPAQAFPVGDYMVLDGLGYWQFSFHADGSYRIVLNEGLVVVERGSYVVSGPRITLTDQSRFCLARSSGTYAWAVQAGFLNLSLVKDTCLYARYALTKGLVRATPETLARRLPAASYVKTVLATSSADQAFSITAAMAGRWRLDFAADGTFTLAREGQIVAQGQSLLIKDRMWLRFTDMRDCPIEAEAQSYGAPRSAVYDWRLGARDLQLAAMLDGCVERRIVLSHGVWLKRTG